MRDARAMHSAEAAAFLCRTGRIVYAPIAHWHWIAKYYALPTDFQYWIQVNHRILRCCTELYVLCIPGWEQSRGVADERKYAKEVLDLPVYFMKPLPSETGYSITLEAPALAG
jgi:hypothetical protein